MMHLTLGELQRKGAALS